MKILSLLGLTAWLRGRSYTSNFHKKDEFIESVSTALPITELETNETGQGNGATASPGINVVNEVGQAEASVNLPADSPLGYPIVIMNNDGTVLSVWPPAGGSINGDTDGQYSFSGQEKMATAYRIGDNAFFIQGMNEI